MECSICFQEWDSQDVVPKNLPCGHTFCMDCIQRIVKQSARVECPICKTMQNLNQQGISELTTNFAILSMTEDLRIKDKKRQQEIQQVFSQNQSLPDAPNFHGDNTMINSQSSSNQSSNDYEERKEQPSFQNSLSYSSNQPQMSSLLACKFYYGLGSCMNGSECKFNHSLAHVPSKKKVCQFFTLKTLCKKGVTCPFIHNFETEKKSKKNKKQEPVFTPPPVQQIQTKHQCSFHSQGKCTKGLLCNFSHSDVSNQQSIIKAAQQVAKQRQKVQQSAQQNAISFRGRGALRPQRQLCQFYERGECKFGSACRDWHP